MRAYYKALRADLSTTEFNRRSQRVLALLFDMIQRSKPRALHAYMSIERLREIPVEELFDRLTMPISIPKADFNDSSLSHYLWDKDLFLETSQWGIREPKSGNMADLSKVDLVIVPLLAYDKKGNRLGYGKGFYDRFLAQLLKMNPEVIFVGLSLFPAEEALPELYPGDLPLHKLVNPQGLIEFD